MSESDNRSGWPTNWCPHPLLKPGIGPAQREAAQQAALKRLHRARGSIANYYDLYPLDPSAEAFWASIDRKRHNPAAIPDRYVASREDRGAVEASERQVHSNTQHRAR